jgi:aryl-alcohol dehydrogenase-like predicted oxidoreductase
VVLERAIDLGVNYFDTSRVYKDSEKVFGSVIKGKRDKVVISTKTGTNTREQILKDIETSLQMLGTDYVDVYHMHARDAAARVSDEALEAMKLIKKQGKARFIGLSTHDPNAMADNIIKYGLDVVQTTYSYAIGAPFRDAALEKLHAAGVGIIAMKVVIGLTGLKLDMKNPEQKPKITSEGCVAAIKWVLKNPRIGTTVPHHGDVSQLEMNVRAMSESYAPADEKLLYVRNEQNRPFYCRMCYECNGQCPKGVPVTDELRFLAYNDFGGDIRQARRSFMELPEEIRDIRCRDCSACAIQCRNGVRVQDRLIRAQELLA